MASEAEIEAGARAICVRGEPAVYAPCSPEDIAKCSCAKDARAALEAAEKVRESVGAKEWQSDYDQIVARINAAE